MKKIFSAVILLVLASVLLAGCSTPEESGKGVDIPTDYANLSSPLAGSADSALAGKAVYAENCAVCHGEGGRGDGVSATGLDPKPAKLMSADEAGDAYLFWRIAEGGEAEQSAMPAFKSVLSEDQIWQVIEYLKTLE